MLLLFAIIVQQVQFMLQQLKFINKYFKFKFKM